MSSLRLRTRAAASALILAAGTLSAFTVTTFLGAPQASACTIDTDGDCYISSYGYWHIQNTDSSGLWEHTSANINSSTVGSTGLPNGTNIEVVCQTVGTTDPYDNLPYTVWDKLENGTYVYDGYFVSSPGDGYTPVLNRC